MTSILVGRGDQEKAQYDDLLNLGISTVPKAGLDGVELGVGEPVCDTFCSFAATWGKRNLAYTFVELLKAFPSWIYFPSLFFFFPIVDSGPVLPVV